MGETKKDILIRVYFLYAVVCLFGLTIVGKIWVIQNIQGEELLAIAKSQTTKTAKIEPSRGNIYSADGSLLATSVPVYDLYLDMHLSNITNDIFKKNIDSLSYCLANLFKDRSAHDYKKLLINCRTTPGNYRKLKMNVSHAQLQQVYTFPMFRMGRYKGGLIYEVKNKRVKPFSVLAERTIGYKRDGVVAVGLEGSFDHYLKGNTGVRLMQKISGNIWKPVSNTNEIEPRDGNDVITTIDINLQDVAENALSLQLQKHDAEKGCAVLMEVNTGHILAIANLEKDSVGMYRESLNLAIGQSTEPGSTFKLASMMALMEDGYVEPDELVDTQGGQIKYSNLTLKDSKDGGYGVISLKHVFEVSSNVGISKIVNKHYSKDPQKFIDKVRSFGLGDPLGLQLSGERNPYMNTTDSKHWSGVSLPYMSIGYECSFTPLQLLAFYNAVANNGRFVKPMFVKEIRNKGFLVKKFDTEVYKDQIASPKTIQFAHELLEGVVQNGTATNLKSAQYKIAGKTGTAQIAAAKLGYKSGEKIRYQASFVGYFPADHPRYSCIVVVYAPNKNQYYAAQVAAPIFREIADKVYATSIELHRELNTQPLLTANVPNAKSGLSEPLKKVFHELKLPVADKLVSDGWAQVAGDSVLAEIDEKSVNTEGVPDVTGMGLRDAILLLESNGFQIKAVGKGSVQHQSVRPGEKVKKGTEIVLQLG